MTDKNIYCSFPISLSMRLLALIPILGAASSGSGPNQGTTCTLSIGSIRVCEAPLPSNVMVLQTRNGGTGDPNEAEKSPPDKKPESKESLRRVPRVDVKSASKSTVTEKSPGPTSRTCVVASPPSRGDSGRTTTRSGWGKEDYFNTIRRKIAEAKRYPSEAANEGSQGTAVVGFDLHRDGAVSNVRILKSSLSGILDLEAQRTVQRAAPFPAVPPGINGEPLNMRIPLSFEIVKR